MPSPVSVVSTYTPKQLHTSCLLSLYSIQQFLQLKQQQYAWNDRLHSEQCSCSWLIITKEKGGKERKGRGLMNGRMEQGQDRS